MRFHDLCNPQTFPAETLFDFLMCATSFSREKKRKIFSLGLLLRAFRAHYELLDVMWLNKFDQMSRLREMLPGADLG